MSANPGLYEFYIITENDPIGETAHGPYTIEDAKFLVKVDEEIITQQRLTSLRQNRPMPTTSTFSKFSPAYAKMFREIKNWGVVLLILGAIQLFTGGFNNMWAILLIIVGLASFYFRSPAMFVTYGITMLWAAISNALSGSSGWQFFSLLQVYFTYSIFRQYFQFRTIFNDPQNPEYLDANQDKAARPFPWISFFLGIVSFVGLITAFVGAVLFAGLTGGDQVPGFISFIEGIAFNFGVLAFSTGLAAVLSRYQHKVFSIIGIVTGGLVLLTEILFALL